MSILTGPKEAAENANDYIVRTSICSAFLTGKETDWNNPIIEGYESYFNAIKNARTLISNKHELKVAFEEFCNSIKPGQELFIDTENVKEDTKTYYRYMEADEHGKECVTYTSVILGEFSPKDKRITLYGEAINEEASKHYYPFENLIVVILLHELIHAIMDTGRLYGKYHDDDLYAYWKEESYANALTLIAIRTLNDINLTEQAEKFMESQNGPYRYGVYLANEYPQLNYLDWKEEKLGKRVLQTQWLENVQNKI